MKLLCLFLPVMSSFQRTGRRPAAQYMVRRRLSASPRAQDIFVTPSKDEGNIEAGGAGESLPRRSPRQQGQGFLIENSHNDVSRLLCPTRQVLEQGMLETASLPHICIAGESNAGKSSLINHLLHKRSLAKASSVAGKTRSVDMMLVNDRIVVTDLPGLPSRDGQVTAMWETQWRPLVFEYLQRCDGLLAMLYVHDVRWKTSSLVREFLADVEELGLPVLLVLTKDDRLVNELRAPVEPGDEHALRQRLMQRIRRSLNFDGVHLHYSTNSELAASRKARRRLLRYIESMVELGSREECADMLSGIARSKQL